MSELNSFVNQDERIDNVDEKISLIQKIDGFSYGTDAVLLAGYIRKMPKKTAVEFGTGTCTDRKGSGRHPKAQEFGYQYDVNGHGEDGWYYFDQNQNRVRWTKGMRSRPFMFETSVELIDNLENTAKEVFGK